MAAESWSEEETLRDSRQDAEEGQDANYLGLEMLEFVRRHHLDEHARPKATQPHFYLNIEDQDSDNFDQKSEKYDKVGSEYDQDVPQYDQAGSNYFKSVLKLAHPRTSTIMTMMTA